ncbi:TPR repeat protein [Fulvivirga imtechensis AK7]|uniref:TPR repeat protein n=1 Tax=Fulvivirga imtechensis AK7 TaxID=1237149 RepID=L8JHQ7_9BACT|nr:tetratricopeptide repeat protein [Fulvivirga imtechensis]ELR68396.1 TPR repeat protein [Fulvivirga imtechensis AK7]
MPRIILNVLFLFGSFALTGQDLDALYDSALIALDLELAHEVKDLAVESQDLEMLAKAYYLIGYIEKNNSNFSESISAMMEAYILFRELDDQPKMANAQEGLAYIYSNTGLPEAAIKCLKNALDIRKQLKDSVAMSRIYYNLGYEQRDAKKYDSAIICFNQTIEIARSLENNEDLYLCYNNIGAVYQEKGDYDQCTWYYNKALEFDSSIKYKAMIFNNLGNTSLDRADSVQAGEYFRKALKLDTNHIKPRTLVYLNQNLSLLYESRSPDSAIYFREKALHHLGSNYWEMGLSDQYYSACKKLEELYERVGNFEKAKYYDSLQDTFNTSLVKLHKELNGINIRYQIEAANKKRLDAKTRELEERGQTLVYIIILLGVLFISLIIAFWLYYKYKKRSVFIYDRVQKAYQSLEKKEEIKKPL